MARRRREKNLPGGRRVALMGLAVGLLGFGLHVATTDVLAEGPPKGDAAKKDADAKGDAHKDGEHKDGEHKAEGHGSGEHAAEPHPGPMRPDDFDKMMSVLTHKRCTNCHPNDSIPKQGEDSHPHYFDIARGENNMGFAATNCNTCHQKSNNPYSGVPGAPDWSLAPHSMRWEGLTRVEVAKSMLDPKRNGGRNHSELMHHLTEHQLVLWAWTPGVDARGVPREKPPVPKDEYIGAVKRWFAAGAPIPAK